MGGFHHQYTWQDYVLLQKTTETKLEYLAGEIFAMAGGTPQHAALSSAVGGELRLAVEGKGCLVYSSDLRIRVQATGLGAYPDVSVVCGKPELDVEDKDTVVNPKVLVEVLSDSTEAYDRREKFEHFRQIPSLREYVLVSHRERLIEVFHRGEDGEWSRTEARTRARAKLTSIGCELDVDRVYAGIELHEG